MVPVKIFFTIIFWCIAFYFSAPDAFCQKAGNKGLAPEYHCDTSLWKYVYNPGRFRVIEKCVVVSGTVKMKKKENDGDIHIRLRLDSRFENLKLLNEKNYDLQDSCLVVEIICVGNIKKVRARATCAGCTKKVLNPRKESHISVTGDLVVDTKHGWTEIHPVSKIVLLKEKQ